MNFDISHLLERWDYEPGRVVVRKFTGKDGTEKIQLRVDLGILQMNLDGRPDGKRPLGHESLFDFYSARLNQHQSEHEGQDEGFGLSGEDCAKLQIEALQFHHRSICLLELQDYAGVLRDTGRNLTVLDFVNEYAETDDLAWSLQQFRPQVIMLRTRAQATQELQANKFSAAIEAIQSGLEALREFYAEYGRQDMVEQSPEILSIQEWLDEINRQRPLSRRERLELDLDEAVKCEDYEKAAQVRDALRHIKPTE